MTYHRDLFSSLFLVLFACGVCVLSRGLTLWTPDGPGDGFFPFLGGLALALFGLCLFFQSLKKHGVKRKTSQQGIDKTKLFTYVGCILVYPLVFELLGFFLTTFMFLLIICKQAEKAGWGVSILVSGFSSVCSFYIFYRLLDVPFPLGPFK